MSVKLKYVRIIIAFYFFIILSLSFLNIHSLLPSWTFRESSTFFQFVPSLLKSTLIPITSVGFIFVLALTFLYGRVYCSVICPLGIFQDIISRLSKPFRKIKIYRHSKPYNYLRYSILVLVIISLFAGSTFLLNLLDPYSNFGKIWSVIFRPIAITINDLLSALLEKTGSYVLSPIGIRSFNWFVLIYPFVFLAVILFLASFRGRLFCNTICPVGSILALASKLSFFKIKIDGNSCTRCGKCSSVCKAECIDIKEKDVDFDRCIGCFNCIKACPENSIKYNSAKLDSFVLFGNKKTLNQNTIGNTNAFSDDKGSNDAQTLTLIDSRRNFLQKSLILGIAVGLSTLKSKTTLLDNIKSGLIAFKKKHTVTPPGSYRADNFIKHCTACHLCVSACPSQVLQPSLMQYGIQGIFQPFMDYDNSYCNYECVKCSEVCPTGAIIPITPEQKKTVQIGKVIFLKNNCIVYTEEKSCGACSEHCPTKAVRMVSYKGALTIPETEAAICVGCGACEYACPAEPYKAIYVEGNPVHQTAFKYKEEKTKENAPVDFPF